MITKYDPKIYPLKLYVAVGDDQRENVKKKFSTDFDINQDLFSDCDAMTLMVRERKTRHLGVLIWLSRDGLGIRAVCMNHLILYVIYLIIVVYQWGMKMGRMSTLHTF